MKLKDETYLALMTTAVNSYYYDNDNVVHTHFNMRNRPMIIMLILYLKR